MENGDFILVVEDEFLIALEVTTALEAQGYQVAAVATGDAALGAVVARHPDLALVDIRLRGELDGIETARQLYHFHHVPIVFMTIDSDPLTMQRAGAAVPAEYMVKPFDAALLTTTVAATLER